MPNFHPLDGLTAQEAQADDIREFTGDGTPYLKVPGLRSVKSVRVGRLTLPETRVVKTPKNLQFTEFDVVEHPMYAVQTYPDGTPVLLRSTLSNNGFWQAGERIFVAGEWDDAAQKADDQKADDKKADEKKPDDKKKNPDDQK